MSSESRKRFLFRFFVFGACAPAVWVGVRYALRDLPISLGHSEILGWVLYIPDPNTFSGRRANSRHPLSAADRGTNQRRLVRAGSNLLWVFQRCPAKGKAARQRNSSRPKSLRTTKVPLGTMRNFPVTGQIRTLQNTLA